MRQHDKMLSAKDEEIERLKKWIERTNSMCSSPVYWTNILRLILIYH